MCAGTWQWVCVTLLLHTAGTWPGQGSMENRAGIHPWAGPSPARDTGEPLVQLGLEEGTFSLVVPPGCRWMSHKLSAPLPRRQLSGKTWFRQ